MDTAQFFNEVIAIWEKLMPVGDRPMVDFELEIGIDDRDFWCVNYKNRAVEVLHDMADEPLLTIGMSDDTWGYIKARYLKHRREIPDRVDSSDLNTRRFVNGINGLKDLNGSITFQDRNNQNRRVLVMIGEPLPSDPRVTLTGDESLFDNIGSIQSISGLLTSGQVKMSGNLPFLMKIASMFMKK